MKLSIIIPTKDREEKIKSTISFLSNNIFFFEELIIIDSSEKDNDLKNYIKKFNFKIKYLNSKPSISIQRNIGLKNIDNNNDYVMFLDDDIKFEKNSLIKMKKFIEDNHQKYVGFGFNLITKNQIKKKRNHLLNIFKIYSNKLGKVSQSGWHSLAFNLTKNTVVDWISAAASIYNKHHIKNIYFDEFFKDYSYLEDLDFSYSARKRGELVVVAKAKFFHENFINRSSFEFGVKEIVNRAYFVKKNNLDQKLFMLSSLLKLLDNFIKIKPKYLLRSAGNLKALLFLKKFIK